MAEFEEQKKFWRIFYSPLVLIILLVVFLFMARAMLRVYDHEQTSTQDRARVEKELASAQERQVVLKEKIENLETQKGTEDEIRAKFNVVKEGEGVAVILKNASETDSTTTPVVVESWWQKFVGFLRD